MMSAFSAADLLSAWETQLDSPLLEKSLYLLALACSLPDTRAAAQMSIGERDARLLQLRERMFGTQLKNRAICPHCAEAVEWENDTADFHLQAPSQAEMLAIVHQVEAEGYQIRFRLPNSEDIARLRGQAVAAPESQHRLLADCILEVTNGEPSKTLAPENLPASAFEILSRRMEKEDPQANISLTLNCPACQGTWETSFDIQSYLWAEIDNWAKHTLHEVYLLAGAFGWSERDILGMHPLRRRLYLQMIGS